MRAWKMFFFYQLSHGWKHHIGSSIVRHTVLKILEREPLKRTRFAFSSFTPLNWDFVLYLGGKRTERFLSELFLPHEKTTCIKAGKTMYAAFGKAGNPRVTGIQTAIKFSVIFPYTKFMYMVQYRSGRRERNFLTISCMYARQSLPNFFTCYHHFSTCS